MSERDHKSNYRRLPSRNRKKVCIALIMLVAIALFACLPAFAHSGRTDSNGGHYDNSTGEYHYHHGYSAHQHENGICPYDYDDKTGSNVSSGESSEETSDNELGIWAIIIGLLMFVALIAVALVGPYLLVYLIGAIAHFINFVRERLKGVSFGDVMSYIAITLGYLFVTGIAFYWLFYVFSVGTAILICLAIIIGALGLGFFLSYLLHSRKDCPNSNDLFANRMKAGLAIGVALIPIVAIITCAPSIISTHEHSNKTHEYSATSSPSLYGHETWTWEGLDLEGLSPVVTEPSITTRQDDTVDTGYILDTANKRIHNIDCSLSAKLKDEYKEYRVSIIPALKDGYTYCSFCFD